MGRESLRLCTHDAVLGSLANNATKHMLRK